MATYKTPGVYVEEIRNFPSGIEQVESAFPAFIGYTSKAGLNGDQKALLFKPTIITSIREYENIFGGPFEERITVTINDSLDSDNNLTERDIIVSPQSKLKFFLYYSIRLFFDNGGLKCYIVSVGNYQDQIIPGDNISGLKGGIKALEILDEPTLILFPDAVSLKNVDQYGSLVQYSLQSCATLKDRFTIADVKVSDNNQYLEDAINKYRDALGMENLKYGACYYPFIKTIYHYHYTDESVKIIHLENNKIAIVDPVNSTFNRLKTIKKKLYSDIQRKIIQLNVTIPPSGAVAGIYTMIDITRGVWKAPANTVLISVTGPSNAVTANQQDNLNVDTATGKSINSIRFITGRGTVIMGARTLAGNDNEWKYIPVIRSTICIEESIKKSLNWLVFESNDANTWTRMKATIVNYLITIWRSGALQGAKPDDAFYVKTGLGETMTSADMDQGRLIIEIGMALVRPAEFHITRIAFKMQVA